MEDRANGLIGGIRLQHKGGVRVHDEQGEFLSQELLSVFEGLARLVRPGQLARTGTFAFAFGHFQQILHGSRGICIVAQILSIVVAEAEESP